MLQIERGEGDKDNGDEDDNVNKKFKVFVNVVTTHPIFVFKFFFPSSLLAVSDEEEKKEKKR